MKQATALIIATRNAHKVQEIRSILGDRFRYFSLKEFADAPAVVEDARSFAGNATKKAIELARWLGIVPRSMLRVPRSRAFVLADDSGLEVDALNGAPGVNSARFAALAGSKGVSPANSSDAANNARLLQLLQNVPLEKRSARFRCVLAVTPIRTPTPETTSPVCLADELELQTELFEGICEGRIAFAPQGKGGFGYDPLFIPVGYEQSFAKLGEDVKNRISHRAKALEKLQQWLLPRASGPGPSRRAPT